jgi:effector-associated domain 1 (EAD1)-containing protein
MQFWQIYKALIHAFPTEADLAEMARLGLDEDLASITEATNLQEKVFDLIHWAEAQDKLADLVRAAQTSNPTNPQLQALTIPSQPGPEQIKQARAMRTINYVGQWVLVIVLVLGCQLAVVVLLVADAMNRFSAGDNVVAWIYLLVGLLILITVSIGILSTIRAEVRKRSHRP